LNATNIFGFQMFGIGCGITAPIIQQITGTFRKVLLDLTGSVQGSSLRDFVLHGPLSDMDTPYPDVGIQMAVSSTTLNTGNFCRLENISIAGRFAKAGIATYGVCCSLATMVGIQNVTPGAPNAYALALTSNNILGLSSEFTTIATGTCGASGWKFDRCEMHAFTSGSTLSPKALLLEGARGTLYSGGNLAASNGYIVETKGSNQGVTFDTVQFYTDQGPLAGAAIGGTSGTISNLVMINPDMTLAAGGVVVSVGGYNGSMIGGVMNAGGIITNFNISGMGTAPAVSGCHIP
jgi:hypothetical protein